MCDLFHVYNIYIYMSVQFLSYNLIANIIYMSVQFLSYNLIALPRPPNTLASIWLHTLGTVPMGCALFVKGLLFSGCGFFGGWKAPS